MNPEKEYWRARKRMRDVVNEGPPLSYSEYAARGTELASAMATNGASALSYLWMRKRFKQSDFGKTPDGKTMGKALNGVIGSAFGGTGLYHGPREIGRMLGTDVAANFGNIFTRYMNSQDWSELDHDIHTRTIDGAKYASDLHASKISRKRKLDRRSVVGIEPWLSKRGDYTPIVWGLAAGGVLAAHLYHRTWRENPLDIADADIDDSDGDSDNSDDDYDDPDPSGGHALDSIEDDDDDSDWSLDDTVLDNVGVRGGGHDYRLRSGHH